MASTLSNLYVERASSEHPIALWMLNEQVDYVSQITEDERRFELFAKWDIVNAEAEARSSTELNAPFLDSATSVIEGFLPPTPTMDIVLTSKFLLSDDLALEYANFNIGFYVFLETALAKTISIGYKYTDIATNQPVEVLSTKNVTSRYKDNWVFVSNTFDLPPDSSIAEDVKIVIKVRVAQGGVSGAYDFFINGLSVGQWSEEFNKTSYGVTLNSIPTNIALPPELKSLPAFPYGASGENAYYLSQDFRLLAKNFGVPIVFGSSNVTKITENVYNNVNYPSLIFPGYGFLNKRGRHNDYTIEMWIRVNANSLGTKRIFGPIGSTDGLYVDEAFLTLKVGNSAVSHFVGDWFRPMLIHIRVVRGSIFLILNGEEVANIDIDQDTLELPDEFDNINRSKDWLGFYAYEDISPIEIDTFSIYSYPMPTAIAKRRWVWGQAVTAPEQTNSSINSITAFNDYSFANYAANYNYPDFANWKQAYFSNVNAESKVLSLPDYALPDFRLGSRTVTELFKDIKLIGINPEESDQDNILNRKYITLSPNSGWNSETDHIYFENFGILNEPVETVYGVFKTNGTEIDKTLIKITNKINNNSFRMFINNLVVTYETNIDGVSRIVATRTIKANEKFAVGLDIKKLFRSQDSALNRFFTDQSSLDMYVAGDGTSKFNGQIYKIGFDAAYNSRRTSWMYDDDGIIVSEVSYTITDVSSNGRLFQGSPAFVKITSIPDSTSIFYAAAGGKTPTAGAVVNPITIPDSEIIVGSATVTDITRVETTDVWNAKLSGVGTITGLRVGDSISATDGTGALFGGSPTSVKITQIQESPKEIFYRVVGGSTPTAGSVTDLKTVPGTSISFGQGTPKIATVKQISSESITSIPGVTTLWSAKLEGLDEVEVAKLRVGDVISATPGTDGKITFTTLEPHNYLIGDSITTTNIVSNPTTQLNLKEQEVISLTDKTFTINSNISAAYISDGKVTDTANILHDHTANYTLTSVNKYDLLFPDIAVAGYWEDYMPLSYFGKSVSDFDLEKNYELDIIQYNQDFPQPPESDASLETSTWNYGELRSEYSSPVALTYEDLNNEFYTGWQDYLEMSQNSIRTIFYDTKKSTLRSYVSFQPILNGANKSLADFDSFAKPLTSGIIDPAANNLDWENTAFETTSGTIIYPPERTLSSNRRIDFEKYALVYHLDFRSDGILHNPVRFKELQLASQVFERTDFTPIGSKFGIPVYYYSKRGLYFDLKGKNPVSTYKKSTPYLYLDRNSGWKIQGDFDSTVDRGIAIPVNLSRAGTPETDPFEVSSIQMWIRFADRDFPQDPVMIFSIDHNDGIYDFFVRADASEKRGYVFAVNRDSAEIIDEIQYYVNGQSVGVPFLVKNEWIVLGLEFGGLLDFTSAVGLINLNGPLTYNNVSYNLATNIEKSKLLETRLWSDMPKLRTNQITGITTSVIGGVPSVTYSTSLGTFTQGQKVSVFGVTPSQFNLTNVKITSVSGNSFTVASTATGSYVSGGTVESGKWSDVDTTYNEWQQVKVINESVIFNIDPKAIYEKYTGSNRTVIDDNSSGILIDPEKIKVYRDVTWSENLKVPV
jgi:hypothetical protein